MPEIVFNNPDSGSHSEQSPEKIEAKRRKYLKALAISLGANETTAELSVNALLLDASNLSSIDRSKNRHDLDPEQVEKIEALGSWFLTGSKQGNQLKYTVGTWVLALLNESPDSGYFKNINQWVDMWTDGTRGDKFKEMITEEK